MKNDKLDRAFPEPSEQFHAKLCEALENLPESNERTGNMKSNNKFGIKRMLLIGIAAAMLLTGAAFAVGNRIAKSQVSWSSSSYTFDEILTAEFCEKRFGYSPKMVGSFSNGYSFDGATTVTNQLVYDDDSSGEKYKSLDITYVKDGKEISFMTGKVFAGEDSEAENFARGSESKLLESYNGINIYVYEIIMKLVPPDYEMTETDKALEASGDYVFSAVSEGNFEGNGGGMKVGTDEYVKNIMWVEDGVTYNFLVFGNNDVTTDELIAMTHEVIDCE